MMEESNKNNDWSWIPSFILQIGNALQKAYELFDYTHYDLHPKNIIFEPLDSEYYIKYDNYYVKTKFVVKIIDYGFNYIKFENKDFGIIGFENEGIHPNSSYPLYDIVKLLYITKYYFSSNQSISGIENKLPRFIDIILQYELHLIKKFYDKDLTKRDIRSWTYNSEFITPLNSVKHKINDFLNTNPISSQEMLTYKYSDFLKFFEKSFTDYINFKPVSNNIIDLTSRKGGTISNIPWYYRR